MILNNEGVTWSFGWRSGQAGVGVRCQWMFWPNWVNYWNWDKSWTMSLSSQSIQAIKMSRKNPWGEGGIKFRVQKVSHYLITSPFQEIWFEMRDNDCVGLICVLSGFCSSNYWSFLSHPFLFIKFESSTMRGKRRNCTHSFVSDMEGIKMLTIQLRFFGESLIINTNNWEKF